MEQHFLNMFTFYLKGKAKGSKRKGEPFSSNGYHNEARAREEDFEKVQLDSEEERDEFDDMCGANDSLTTKLGVDDLDMGIKRRKFFDDLSDDEEYQQMTEAERNEKMAPNLNLDGHVTDDSDSDEIISSSNSRMKNKRIIKERVLY